MAKAKKTTGKTTKSKAAKSKPTKSKQTKARMAKPARAANGPRLYELQVAIMAGLITEAFAKANPYLHRTIAIRGDQTLEDLHEAIFKAFDRFDSHMYEFQFGADRTMDPKADRYVLPMAMGFGDGADRAPAGTVDQTTIASLGLTTDDAFFYWFDFGDDWWHQIDVVAIHEQIPAGKYPKVIARKGESPPQYPDFDEEEDADDDE